MIKQKHILQRDLFEPLSPVLDVVKGRANKAAGMKKAVEHADKEIPEWSSIAYSFFIKFLSVVDKPFMTEDVRLFAAEHGVPEPPHARAWGPITSRVAKEGLIIKTGIGTVKNVTSNNAMAAIWAKK